MSRVKESNYSVEEDSSTRTVTVPPNSHQVVIEIPKAAANVAIPANPLIHSKMIEVLQKITSIGKEKKNLAQGYNFRGIDDVYNALNPILGEVGIYTTTEVLSERTEERTTKNGSALIYRFLMCKFTFRASDGSSVSSIVPGEGMDSGDKASNKALSVAQKYAFIQAFAIPTEEPKDPEVDSHELKPKNPPPAEKKHIVKYDNSNKDHRDRLENYLKTVECPEAFWSVIRAKLIGQPVGSVKEIVKKIMEEIHE